MMRTPHALVALAVLLAACQAPPPGAPKASAAPAARKPAARASAGASPAVASPAVAAGLVAAAKVAPGDRLLRPAGGVAALQGQVRLDAAYMVATGAGGLVGADGAALVGADGASAVAVAKAPLKAAGAGNAIGARLGADGASLVGADGGTLIGADAGSLIGADAGSYRLAQAPGALASPDAAASASASPALRQLPAAGMLVAAISLATGKPVPVGEDAAGDPVYAVYTDAAGRYAIYPPAAERGNLRVVVVAAGSTDPRLRYGVYARGGADGARDVSEASSLAASYVARCVLSVYDGFLRKRVVTAIERLVAGAGPAGDASPEIAAMRRIERVAAEIGYEDWPDEADRQALLRRVGEIGLSGVSFDELETVGGEPAMPVLERQLASGEAEVAALMAAPPAGRTAATVFDDVAMLGPWKILRPADFNAFVVEKIVAPDPLDSARISERIALLRLEMGLPVDEGAGEELSAACYGIANGLGMRMFSPDAEAGGQPTIDAIEAALRAFVPKSR